MTTGRTLSLVIAAIAVLVALGPPIHDAARTSLSVHMVQHLLLILIAAPLAALGSPSRAIGRLLPLAARRTVGRAIALSWSRHLREAARQPVAVWMVHVTVVWIWHLPALYERALTHDAIHALEHATFFGSAVVFWSLVTRPGRARLGILAAFVYVFTAAMQSAVLGALLVFADRAWYPSHVAAVGPVRALADQQLAGVLMWVPAGVVYVIAIVTTVGAWLGEARRRTATVLGVVITVAVAVGACRRPEQPPPPKTLDGDPVRGAVAIERHGCGACHRIPGVRRARGEVGPPLDGFARRPFIAGALRNDPLNVVRWIRDPQAIEPGTVMPRLGVTEAEARDIAAYLGRLR